MSPQVLVGTAQEHFSPRTLGWGVGLLCTMMDKPGYLLPLVKDHTAMTRKATANPNRATMSIQISPNPHPLNITERVASTAYVGGIR